MSARDNVGVATTAGPGGTGTTDGEVLALAVGVVDALGEELLLHPATVKPSAAIEASAAQRNGLMQLLP
jgi:hypothetical protein